MTGFSTAEIDLMFDTETPAGSDPDDLHEEDIRADVVSRVGDLWQLGHHRTSAAMPSALTATRSSRGTSAHRWSSALSGAHENACTQGN